MPGLRIYHVHPRLSGPIDQWSGLSAPEGKSWLIEQAKSLGNNAIWFSPFYETSEIVVEKNGEVVTNSLYAIREHMTMAEEFTSSPNSTNKDAQDKNHFIHFTNEANDNDMRVMADLVFNHVAADNPFVLEENQHIKSVIAEAKAQDFEIRPIFANSSLIGIETSKYGNSEEHHFKFARNENLEVIAFDGKTDNDTAQINFNSPAAREFFITGTDGEKGYWKQVIDWHLDRGFDGFRCDIAFKIPPEIWSELIQYAHDEYPDIIFLAETLGAPSEQLEAMKDTTITVNGEERLGWDLAMSSTHWWDFRGDWYLDEADTLEKMARFGGTGSADNHDTKDTIAGHYMKTLEETDPEIKAAKVGDICMREYAISALICNSVYMQMGYEYCRDQVDVFGGQGSPEMWEQLLAERGATDNYYNRLKTAQDIRPAFQSADNDQEQPLPRGNDNSGYDLTTRIKAINDFKASLDANHTIVKLKKIETAGTRDDLIRMDCALVDAVSKQEIGKLTLFINENPELGIARLNGQELEDEFNGDGIDRLVLGPGDIQAEHRYDVYDVAAFYTPLENIRNLAMKTAPGISPHPS